MEKKNGRIFILFYLYFGGLIPRKYAIIICGKMGQNRAAWDTKTKKKCQTRPHGRFTKATEPDRSANVPNQPASKFQS